MVICLEQGERAWYADSVEAPQTEEAIDQAILAALAPVAERVEEAVDAGGPVFVTKAVVCVGYVNDRGETNWAYRRVRADWFEVGGAAVMLFNANAKAWFD